MGAMADEVRKMVKEIFSNPNNEEAVWLSSLTDEDCIAIAANNIAKRLVEDTLVIVKDEQDYLKAVYDETH